MAKLVLEIPEDIQAALRFPAGEREQELRRELAVGLYQRQALPFGKARALAHMTRWEFEELFGQRQIPRHYTEEDLQEDIAYATGGE